MNQADLKASIRRIRHELDAVILAHNYQSPDIHDVADIVGDSLELALAARNTTADVLIVCGVTFMAETAKILNPEKKVYIPVPQAGCPLSGYLTPELIQKQRLIHPDAAFVIYINSSAACKACADVVCTSGNAVQMVRQLHSSRVLFGPDANLAGFVQQQVPEKEIIPVPGEGHCYVHQSFTPDDIARAREKGGIIIAHPECPAIIQHGADIVASTGKMIQIIAESDEGTWHIFTEGNMVLRLGNLFPDKVFYHSESAVCKDMRLTTLRDLSDCLQNLSGEIMIEPDIQQKAVRSLEHMLEASV
jgi:quinolinate synthase